MTAARLLTAVVVAASSLVFFAGCSGQIAGQDLTTPPPDPNNPNPDPNPDPQPDLPCAAIAPACAPSDTQYASDAQCKNAGSDYCYTRSSTCNGRIVSTIVCGSGRPQCDAYPVCDEGDTETTGCPKNANARCYTRTMCGTTIMCVHYESTCTALPVCDAGDTQVGSTSSPLCTAPGYSCYSRTVCGTTIACAKKS